MLSEEDAFADIVGLYGEERMGDQCGNSIMLNDFSSKMSMERAGWWFNWTDDFTFKPLMYKDFVPPDSYWGFMMYGRGGISLRVKGEGTLTLDFGNLLGTPDSKVSVYLNLIKKATAGPSVLSQTVDIAYHDSDALTIAQDGKGIIVINRVSFACTTTTTMADSTSDAPTANEKEISAAEARFKKEHAELEAAAEVAEKKEQEHFAALKFEKASEQVLEADEFKEQKLSDEINIAESDAKEQREQEERENQRLVAALLDVLAHDGELVDSDVDLRRGSKSAPGETEEQMALDATRQEKKLAKELEEAAKRDHDAAELAAAQEKEQRAELEEERLEKQLDHAKKIEQMKESLQKNETWAKQAMLNAKLQADRAKTELEEAEKHEDQEAKESEEAAKKMKEVIKMMKVEKEKLEPEVSGPTTITTTTTRLTTGYSLYCFTLMLPFGYEPRLLTKQREKKVGFYRCDEFTVFSNSSVFLDGDDKFARGSPLPVVVDLLDFSLAVDYGGKWHTALNTPVFNKIWVKVRDMKLYLNYDWVVKADIDTVWFPERLRTVLRKGLPHEALHTGGRRLGDDRRLQVSEGCRQCGLAASANDMCEDHVRWLQRNKNMSCEDALKATSRPPPIDCGCKCTKVEACDLSADRDAWLDGHFMKGDYRSATPAIYINNCRFGLHGPIEVLSVPAITAYVDGLPSCSFLEAQPWGEDKFLDRCLMALGITRMNVFAMLSEIACGEEPAPCRGTDVAFHPFKKWEDYDACWEFANSEGQGPFSTGSEHSLKEDAGFI